MSKRQYRTSWGKVFSTTTDVGEPEGSEHFQSRVDNLALRSGIRPPSRRWKQDDDGPVPRWPSALCRSGMRKYCTCNACF